MRYKKKNVLLKNGINAFHTRAVVRNRIIRVFEFCRIYKRKVRGFYFKDLGVGNNVLTVKRVLKFQSKILDIYVYT